MKLTIESNPWSLPGVPIYLEGVPSKAKLARDKAKARAARAVWEPGPEAHALLERLQPFVGEVVIIQGWDPIMLMLEDEGPFPVQARCVGIVTQNDPEGFPRAYLVLESPTVLPTPDGYNGTAQLIAAGDCWHFGIHDLCEIEGAQDA